MKCDQIDCKHVLSQKHTGIVGADPETAFVLWSGPESSERPKIEHMLILTDFALCLSITFGKTKHMTQNDAKKRRETPTF